MYKLTAAKSFYRDYKKIKKRGYDMTELALVVNMLISGNELPKKYCDHALKGKFFGYRECHIKPDWLLVYKKQDDILVLTLSRTGTHSDLFRSSG